MSWLDLDNLSALSLIEGLALAEEMIKLRQSESVEYKVNEEALQELSDFQEELRLYVPDVMDDEFVPSVFKEIVFAEEEVLPPIEIDPSTILPSAASDKAMGHAIDHLYGDNPQDIPQQSPSQALTEKVLSPSPEALASLNEQFQGTNVDSALDGLNTVAGEAVETARRAGYGNLDVKQGHQFFDDESKWSGPK